MSEEQYESEHTFYKTSQDEWEATLKDMEIARKRNDTKAYKRIQKRHDELGSFLFYL